jgi:hypothetical protein
MAPARVLSIGKCCGALCLDLNDRSSRFHRSLPALPDVGNGSGGDLVPGNVGARRRPAGT